MSRIKKSEHDKEKPSVHKDLEGLDLKINEFGEVIGNTSIDKINEFLNKNVSDKKLDVRDGAFGEDQKAQESDEADKAEEE